MEDIEIDELELNRQIREMDTYLGLIKKARHKFIIDLYQQKLLLLCQQGRANNQIQQLYDEITDLRKQTKLLDETSTYSYFVCCNPSPSVDLTLFLNTCRKSITKCWIEQFCYVIEQRGTNQDEVGKGFHYHAVIVPKEGKKLSHIVRELSNTFKKVTDTSNYHFFSVKPITKGEHLRKLKYIVGYKQDEEKIQKQRIDVMFREQHGIEKCYTSQDFNFEGMYENVE